MKNSNTVTYIYQTNYIEIYSFFRFKLQKSINITPIPEMTWLEELDILTRFHSSNVAFSKLDLVEEEDKKKDEKEVEKESGKVFKKFAKVRSIGRGRSRMSNQDDFFITRKIEEVLGSAHRVSDFNFTNTIPHGKKSNPIKKAPTPDSVQIVTIRPKLVKMSALAGRKGAADNEKEKSREEIIKKKGQEKDLCAKD